MELPTKITNGLSFNCSALSLLNKNDKTHFASIQAFNQYQFHHYAICEYPRIIVLKDFIKITSKEIRLQIKIDNIKDYLDIIFFNTDNVTKIILNKAGNLITFYSGEKRLTSISPVTLLSQSPQFQNVLKFKILYIGKTYDATKKRTIIDRLDRHEKCLDIGLDILNSNRNVNIYFVLFEFKATALSFFPPSDKDDEIFDKEFVTMQKMQNHKLIPKSEYQSVIEASLINYFKPEYNKNFKELFPCNKHDSYKTLNKENISLIHFSINTSTYNFSLYSEVIKPKLLHDAQFFL